MSNDVAHGSSPHAPEGPGGGSGSLAAVALAGALGLALLLRHQAAQPPPPPPVDKPAPGASARPAVLPPLAAPPAVTLSGGALVLPPLGATTSRPVVLGWGGAETPAALCGLLGRVVGPGQAFVVCPQPLGRPPGAAPGERAPGVPAPGVTAPGAPGPRGGPGPRAALAPLRASLAELRARFGFHVAPGAVVVVAVGAGTEDALTAMRDSPHFFSRLALVHGGHEAWVGGVPPHFGRGGGRRVLFVCPAQHCTASAEAAEARTRPTGALARVALLPGTPAPLGPETEAALREHWEWLAAP